MNEICKTATEQIIEYLDLGYIDDFDEVDINGLGRIIECAIRAAQLSLDTASGDTCPSCKEMKALAKDANPGKYPSHKPTTVQA